MGEPQKKRKRPRRGFVACPGCGAESRMGLKTCPECGVKLPGAGGFPVWILVVVVLGIGAIAAGAYFMREEKPERKAKKPPEERVETKPVPDEPVVKEDKKEEVEEDVLDLFGDAGLPEPTLVAPGTEKVKPKEEGEDEIKE